MANTSKGRTRTSSAKNPGSKMAGPKRKPTVKRTAKTGVGSGGLQLLRNLNWRRLALPVLAVALLGGFLVYKSLAAGQTWKPGSTAITTTSSVKVMTKKNGAQYWYTTAPVTASSSSYAEAGKITLTNPAAGAGTFCVEARAYDAPMAVTFSGASAGSTNLQTLSAGARSEICTYADLASGSLSATLQRSNGSTQSAQTNQLDIELVILKVFKKSDAPVTAKATSQKCADLTNVRFCDDFDGPAGSAPDSKKWNVFTSGSSWGSHCWSNKPENISLDGQGNIKMTLIDKKTNLCTNFYKQPSTISSGGMDTSGRFTTKYGKFEIRAKIPCTKSVWGALWLSTGAGGPSWPESGEIDIWEMSSNYPKQLVQTTWMGASGSNYYRVPSKYDHTEDLCKSYHVYGVDWQPGYIQYTFDGKPTKRVTQADAQAEAKKAGKTFHWPFDTHDLRLLVDLQYGRKDDWMGTPDPSELPSSMYVDYVRVY